MKFIVVYVGLSENEYDANGYSEVALCDTLEDAKKKLAEWRQAEIDDLEASALPYEIWEDEDDFCRIGWFGGSEQLRLEIHSV